MQGRSIRGGEAKTLPYLLGQLNLLLAWRSCSAHRLGQRSSPPSLGNGRGSTSGGDPHESAVWGRGGSRHPQQLSRRPENHGDCAAFPSGHHAAAQAREATVAPQSLSLTARSSATASAARIKAELLEHFNVHTIVRLPEGVFAPYTDIPVNLIFFDTSGPTRSIWYYEQPLPDGRRRFTKTAPMVFDEDFQPCLAWWRQPRDETSGRGRSTGRG